MNSWVMKPLGAVIELQRGHDLPFEDRRVGVVPIIGSFGVTGFHDQAKYAGPGVAIGRSGASIGRATYVEGGYWPLNTALFVKDFKGNVPYWTYLALRRIDFTGFNSGSAQPSLNRNFLGDIPVMVPPRQEQEAIAEVLGALDDKIAANDRLVSTLNQLASAAFRERNDSTVRLTSIARFVNGKNFTKGASGSGRVVVRIAEMNSGIGGSTVYSDADVPEENLVRPGDVLFAWSGSLTVQRWSRPEAIVNQHIFKVVPELGVPKWVVYEALLTQLPEFRAIAAGKATTMGHIQRRHLEVDVAVPSVEVIEDLHELMQGMWDRALAADQESRTLAELRDTLLPALMDGTIRVKDAVTAAEEVL